MSSVKKTGERKTLSPTDQAIDVMLRSHGSSLAEFHAKGVENTRQLIYAKYLQCAQIELDRMDERIKALEAGVFVKIPAKVYIGKFDDGENRGSKE